MKTYFNDSLYEYIMTISPVSHHVLQELRDYTSTLSGAHMQISYDQACLMHMLAKIINAKRYLEIGVFTGYSLLNMMLAMGNDARSTAIDHDAQCLEIAKSFWRKCDLLDNITVVCEDAMVALPTMQDNQFDIAFIDANKKSYDIYYENCLRLVRKSGLIIIDNIVMHGEVLDGQPTAIIALNEKIKFDCRVDYHTVLPIADGLTILRVL